MIGLYYPSLHYTRRIMAGDLTWIYRKTRPRDDIKKILLCRTGEGGYKAGVLAELNIIGACLSPSWSMWKLTAETDSKKPERFRWDFRGVDDVYGVKFEIVRKFRPAISFTEYGESGDFVLIEAEK